MGQGEARGSSSHWATEPSPTSPPGSSRALIPASCALVAGKQLAGLRPMSWALADTTVTASVPQGSSSKVSQTLPLGSHSWHTQPRTAMHDPISHTIRATPHICKCAHFVAHGTGHTHHHTCTDTHSLSHTHTHTPILLITQTHTHLPHGVRHTHRAHTATHRLMPAHMQAFTQSHTITSSHAAHSHAQKASLTVSHTQEPCVPARTHMLLCTVTFTRAPG